MSASADIDDSATREALSKLENMQVEGDTLIPAFIDIVKRGEPTTIRRCALDALGELEERWPSEKEYEIPRLAHLFDLNIVNAKHDVTEEEFLPILELELRHQNEGIAEEAIVHFLRWWNPSDDLGKDILSHSTKMRLLLDILARDPRESVRDKAMRTIGDFGSAGRAAIPTLTTLLQNGDEIGYALTILRKIGPGPDAEPAIPDLLRLGRQSSTTPGKYDVLDAAIAVLKGIGTPKAVEAMEVLEPLREAQKASRVRAQVSVRIRAVLMRGILSLILGGLWAYFGVRYASPNAGFAIGRFFSLFYGMHVLSLVSSFLVGLYLTDGVVRTIFLLFRMFFGGGGGLSGLALFYLVWINKKLLKEREVEELRRNQDRGVFMKLILCLLLPVAILSGLLLALFTAMGAFKSGSWTGIALVPLLATAPWMVYPIFVFNLRYLSGKIPNLISFVWRCSLSTLVISCLLPFVISALSFAWNFLFRK
jgi:hypothetical protein